MKKILRRGLSIIVVFLVVTIYIQAKDFVVTNFGVKPDGITINTTSIQSLIDRVNKKEVEESFFRKANF